MGQRMTDEKREWRRLRRELEGYRPIGESLVLVALLLASFGIVALALWGLWDMVRRLWA